MKRFDDVLSGVDDMLGSVKKGNFDEVLNKTKDYASKATKKGSQGVELSRKRIELFDVKTKLAKAYEAFGKLQYDEIEGVSVSDEERQSCLAQIELHKTRAQLLEEEIASLKEQFTSSVKPEEK